MMTNHFNFDSNNQELVLNEAYQYFRDNGFVRLDNVFEPAFMEQLQAHYQKYYAFQLWHTQQHDKHPLYTVKVEKTLADPNWFANPKVFPLIQKLVGEDCIIGAMSVIVSFPGACDQRIHRDNEPLYGPDYHRDVELPPYALTMLVPLVDCNLETGCTRVWPKSHKLGTQNDMDSIEPLDPEVKVGNIMMTDSKLIHLGAANVSQQHRPVLYITFLRKWYRDFGGYDSRPPLYITPKALQQMPSRYRELFLWSTDRYKKWRTKDTIFRLMPNRIRKIWNKAKGRG